MLNLGIAFFFKSMIGIEKYIIIVAGGIGTRMESEMPKQFLLIHKQPVIIHTIQTFLEVIPDAKIIIVIHASWHQYLLDLLKALDWQDKIQLVEGGPTRFHSVKNGMDVIQNVSTALLAIHDAARPLASSDTIINAMQSAYDFGSGIPVIEVSESLRTVVNQSNQYLDRSLVRIVQTPQCFQFAMIKAAFEQPFDPAFTDDASVIEKLGHKVYLTKGNQENIKITWPLDLKVAEVLLSQMYPMRRIY